MNSIVDLGNSTKPISDLMAHISNAIGKIYEPTHIRRMAAAEAEAFRIKEKASVGMEMIRQRADLRASEELIIQQANIESIISRAIQHLLPTSNPAQIERDWLAYYFERAKLISDEQMQDVWARILSEESNNPGAFRKKTINTLSQLEKSDAISFRKFCSIVWMTELDGPAPLIIDEQARIYKKFDIGFELLSHLEDIGLIKYNTSGKFCITDFKSPMLIRYFDKVVELALPAYNGSNFQVGSAFLTKTGIELFKICNPEFDEEFYEFCKDNWRRNGFLH